MILGDIAHGRSGDKGNHANVAVIAYTPAGFDWLRQHLTAERVREYFAPLKPSTVERFEASNLLALNCACLAPEDREVLETLQLESRRELGLSPWPEPEPVLRDFLDFFPRIG